MNRRATVEYWHGMYWATFVINNKRHLRVYGTMREALQAVRFYHETGVV